MVNLDPSIPIVRLVSQDAARVIRAATTTSEFEAGLNGVLWDLQKVFADERQKDRLELDRQRDLDRRALTIARQEQELERKQLIHDRDVQRQETQRLADKASSQARRANIVAGVGVLVAIAGLVGGALI